MEGKPIRSFARRLARPLRSKQQDLLQTLLPKIQIKEPADIKSKCEGFEKHMLEIGFGNGEFLFNKAIAAPDTLFIGAEPYINGVASLLSRININRVENIRVFTDDCRILIDMLPKSYLDEVYIICPDPWPKKRHHKRRLVSNELLCSLHSHMKEQGVITIVTDHEGYAEWIFDIVSSAKGYDFAKSILEDCAINPSDFFTTKYQRRGLALGSKIYRFALRKIGVS